MAANLAPGVGKSRLNANPLCNVRFSAPAPSSPAATRRKCYWSAEPHPRHSLEAFRFDYLLQNNTLRLRVAFEPEAQTKIETLLNVKW